MNRITKITPTDALANNSARDTGEAGVAPFSSVSPTPTTSGPFDTEGRRPQPLDPWAANGGLEAADERRDTASAVGGQSERGSVTDADAGLSPALLDQWRNPPDCKQCGRGFYGCICGCPEPEPEYFRPALNRDPDWYRVEL
jgi:hypothetical protein